ncbi:MAG TPA: methyltransferase domain-containing protein [Acidimicrobiia bacterium]
MSAPDAWNPTQYGKFGAERARPFDDLLALVDPVPGGCVVDLGCGTGELTARLHEHLGAADTLGVDSSAAMLEKARPLEGDGLRFERGDIAAFAAEGDFDVVFSNAALHWIPDHPALLARLRHALRPGGQLAVQVPASGDHPSHALAFEVAREAPYADALRAAGDPLTEATPVLPPERYAALLDELGFADQHVRLQVYGHHLASTADVVEWTKGTTLTRYERGLPPDLFAEFVDRYRARVLTALGERSPYFYTFKRLLFRGVVP